MIDMEEGRPFVIESAIQNNLGTKEEIVLYKKLSLALELMKDNNFDIIYSSVGGGIDFGIVTPYPKGLPENVGSLFYNIDFNFDVKIQETERNKDIYERYFQINIAPAPQSVTKKI